MGIQPALVKNLEIYSEFKYINKLLDNALYKTYAKDKALLDLLFYHSVFSHRQGLNYNGIKTENELPY